LRTGIPTGLHEGRGDELGADITFRKTFFIHWSPLIFLWKNHICSNSHG
jgi:hypothetical protein